MSSCPDCDISWLAFEERRILRVYYLLSNTLYYMKKNEYVFIIFYINLIKEYEL